MHTNFQNTLFCIAKNAYKQSKNDNNTNTQLVPRWEKGRKEKSECQTLFFLGYVLIQNT